MRRRIYFAVALLALSGLAASALFRMPALLVWNASASVPPGLYLIIPVGQPLRGDLVAVMPPPQLAEFLAERGYIGAGLPLLKQITGLPGQRICRDGSTVELDGVALGEAQSHDRAGRILPLWQGCRLIAEGEVLLMNTAVSDSLDGRYFGALPVETIIGPAIPLWVEAGADAGADQPATGQ